VSRSTVSRRFSEFIGVALFAAALIWVISLASYEPTDPAWFFTTTGHHLAPANFAGRVGASSSSSVGTRSGAARSTPPAPK
jgi:hypothetical protein